MSKVFLLHISDLHLKPPLPDGLQDREADIRSEVLREVAKWRKEHSADGRVIGILVTGDIAAQGKADEFETAKNWFKEVTDTAGCDVSKVYTVPGNHDVDRSLFAGNDELADLHCELRKVPPEKLEERLRELLMDQAASSLLLSPLSKYSEFALGYRCAIRGNRLAWSQIVELGEGISIRVIGLTTALISNKNDARGEKGVVLGAWQAIIPSDDKSLTIVLMHHPPGWLRDGMQLERPLGNRAHLLLSGHEHSFYAKRVEPFAGRHFLWVEAGALHPDKSEIGWEPRFNWVEIEYPSSHAANTATLRVYPFRWDAKSSSFQREVGPIEASLDLHVEMNPEPISAPSLVEVPDEAVNIDPINLPRGSLLQEDKLEDADPRGRKMPAAERPDARAVYFRYRELPTATRVRLLLQLGLTVDNETRAATEQGIRTTLAEVQSRGLASQFVDAVWQKYNES